MDNKNIVGQHAEPIFILPFWPCLLLNSMFEFLHKRPSNDTIPSKTLWSDSEDLELKSFYEEAPLLHWERYLIFTGKNQIIQEFWNIPWKSSRVLKYSVKIWQSYLPFLHNPEWGFSWITIFFWKINCIRNIGESIIMVVIQTGSKSSYTFVTKQKALHTPHWLLYAREKQIWAIYNPTVRNPICKNKPS